MEISYVIFIIVSLLLVTIEARQDPGEYWRGVMKDQPMPEAIEGLINPKSEHPLSSSKSADCHTSTEDSKLKEEEKKSPFVKDFEPIPNISAYKDEIKLTQEKPFVDDFEPRPNISSYKDEAKLKQEKPFLEDFEPRPNISVYHDDGEILKEEKSFAKDFDARPDATFYQE